MALDISNVAPLPPVKRDSPTRQAGGPPRADEPAPPALSGRPKRTKVATAEPAVAPTIEDALASAPKAITNRIAGDLWSLLGTRADELGVPIRVVLTDAIVRALEDDVEAHRQHVKATRTREQLAKIERS